MTSPSMPSPSRVIVQFEAQLPHCRLADRYPLQRKLRDAGAVADLITVPGAGHGIRYWSRSGDAAAWQKEMFRWLDKTLAGTKHLARS